MKYTNKCVTCHRNGTKRFRGQYFCSDHFKEVKRCNPKKYVLAYKPIGVIFDMIVYRDYPVRLR